MKTSSVAIFKQLLAASFCCLGVVVVGVNIGWPSPIIIKMKETGVPVNLTDVEINLMISILYAGNIVSPIPAGFLIDLVGRKSTLLLCSVFPLCGWILVYFANKAYEFYIARFLFGLWSGIAGTIVPLYIAEIAEARVRGILSTIMQLAFNTGMLLSYIVGSLVNHYTCSIILASFPVCFFFCFVFMPETPYWLVLKKKREAALKSLIWLRATENEIVQAELRYIERCISDDGERKNAFKDLLCSKNYKKALITVFIITFFQRWTGINVVISYVSTVLPSEGIGVLSNSQCFIVIAASWIPAIPIASLLIDNVGRKPLLIISSIVCGFAMFAIGSYFLLVDVTLVDISNAGWVIFTCFIIFGFSFYAGLGPVISTLYGEMFPTNVKALASGLAVINLSVTSFLCITIYHIVGENVGYYLAYWIFSLICFSMTLFVAFYVIETKGKTLHEIQVELDSSRKRISHFH